MTEIQFSKDVLFTEFFSQLEVALGNDVSQNTQVSLSKSTFENSQVLYRAKVHTGQSAMVSSKLWGALKTLTGQAGFLQSKAVHPQSKADNWAVFQRLLRNELVWTCHGLMPLL